MDLSKVTAESGEGALLMCAVTAVPFALPKPTYGDLFTWEDFVGMLKMGALTDYDGYGVWSDGMYVEGGTFDEELDWEAYGGLEPSHRPPQRHLMGVHPSNFFAGRHWKPTWATHVVWFNR